MTASIESCPVIAVPRDVETGWRNKNASDQECRAAACAQVNHGNGKARLP
jgi:hypothetical protein